MPLSDQLRTAIKESGLSATALAKECGIPQPMLTRFINGLDVRLATADKLAEHFGLELRPAEAKKTAKKKPTANP